MFDRASPASPSPRRPLLFWGVALLTVALELGFVAALTLGTEAVGRERLPYQTILAYQEKKRDAGIPPIVFLGDSSLGNAIDAALWTQLSGRATKNLALTGVYGYEASYAFLREILKHGKPERVIFMQAADMMMRPVSHQTAKDLKPPSTWLGAFLRVAKNNLNFQQAWDAWRFVRARKWENPDTKIANDYIKQGEGRPGEPVGQRYDVAHINKDKAYYLQKLGETCRKGGVECLYVHGPLAEPLCRDSEAYFEEVNRLVVAAGLILAAPRPACIPYAKLGDSLDHVAPAYKQAYTRLYFDWIGQR